MVDTKDQKSKKNNRSGSLPSDSAISSIADVLVRKFQTEEKEKKYASVKQILSVIAHLGGLSIAIAAPKSAPLFLKLTSDGKKHDYDAWKRYNTSYLKRTIRRLRDQKLVTVDEGKDYQKVTLTQDGKRKVLKYVLNEMNIPKPDSWDGRWRIVMYDVSEKKRHLRDIFRMTLARLGFHKLQDSTWIYPYPCEKEITFLREYYGVGSDVLYIVAEKLENEAPYREFFGV